MDYFKISTIFLKLIFLPIFFSSRFSIVYLHKTAQGFLDTSNVTFYKNSSAVNLILFPCRSGTDFMLPSHLGPKHSLPVLSQPETYWLKVDRSFISVKLAPVQKFLQNMHIIFNLFFYK